AIGRHDTETGGPWSRGREAMRLPRKRARALCPAGLSLFVPNLSAKRQSRLRPKSCMCYSACYGATKPSRPHGIMDQRSFNMGQGDGSAPASLQHANVAPRHRLERRQPPPRRAHRRWWGAPGRAGSRQAIRRAGPLAKPRWVRSQEYTALPAIDARATEEGPAQERGGARQHRVEPGLPRSYDFGRQW
ncbi:MAG: hypothetical protein RLZZ187_1546, partial [Pseudomonadota bacterium]